jgi:hypothetical protein
MITVLNMIAAVTVLVCGLAAINKMTRRTSQGMRVAWLALTTGALGVLVAPLYGYPSPGVWGTALNVGIALHLVFERRRSDRRCLS